MENRIGKVEFEDPQENKHLFWVTYDSELEMNWFEVWQEHESLGRVNRASTAFDLIALHIRLIVDEDNFFDELGVDADDWDGIKNKLWNIARGAQADPWDDQGDN